MVNIWNQKRGAYQIPNTSDTSLFPQSHWFYPSLFSPMAMRSLIPPSLGPSPPLSLSNKPHLSSPHQFHLTTTPQSFPKFSLQVISTDSPSSVTESKTKLSPAEVSRSIMDLAQAGTLSALSNDTWPLAIGARFVLDPEGAPALCLNPAHRSLAVDTRSSFHVKVLYFYSVCLLCTGICYISLNLVFGLGLGIDCGHRIDS
jgi:hypothetical protein